MNKQALWLPRNSVKAILAFGLLALVGYLAITTKSEVLIGAVVMMARESVRDYFNKEGGDNDKGPETLPPYIPKRKGGQR